VHADFLGAIAMPHLASVLRLLGPQIIFPAGAAATEQIVLRWIHLVFGIIWIGLLYFFNLVGFRTMKELPASVRAELYPALMSRAMGWFRWSALITVIAGLRYFFIILSTDAHNAGNPSLAFRWFGEWLAIWLVAFAVIYPLELPSEGWLKSNWVRAIAISLVVIAASWIVLQRNSGPQVSNSHLSISIGGGLGLLMLLNTWGIVWRAQKRLIAWTRASIQDGTPMPKEAQRLASWALIASRAGFWLSLPMLFFMGAADHYPFLSNITN
jgi:uncharacterized membrane protein